MSDEIKPLSMEKKTDRKILLFGSAGAGKTTTIKTLCDSFILDESHGSVMLDCGKLKLSSSEDLLLYATHDHDYSKSILPEAAWHHLKNDMVGIILLIDNRRKDPLRDLETFLLKLSSQNRNKNIFDQLVVGITHFDSSRTPAISDFHSFMDDLDLLPQQSPPVFSVDTRSFQDISMLIQALLYSLEPTMNTMCLKENGYS